jgi:hypothetical protein
VGAKKIFSGLTECNDEEKYEEKPTMILRDDDWLIFQAFEVFFLTLELT